MASAATAAPAAPDGADAGIRGGVRYLDELRAHFEDSLPPRERTWFATDGGSSTGVILELARVLALYTGAKPKDPRWAVLAARARGN